MIKDDVLSLSIDTLIRHKKKMTTYRWLGMSKVKINGEWIDSGSYQSVTGFIYTRMLDDFDGFVVVK